MSDLSPGARNERTTAERVEEPRILLVAASHGFPPTKARLERAVELVRALTAAGAVCDVVVLCERVLQPAEEEALEDLRSWARRVDKVPHPSVDSLVFQAISGVRDAFSIPPRLGGRQHCPSRILSLLRSMQAEEDYRAVIVTGVHLARALSVFPSWTEKLLDVERIGSEVHRDHERHGRADVFQLFDDASEELRLLESADAVIVGSAADAVRLRELGLTRDLVLAPATGGVEAAAIEVASRQFREPIRPPRILCVGSETPANLDAVRWFRRQVFPRIARAVPTCRLRLVGEMARHIEPGPSVDRIGWVDRLHEEYRDCAVVALPLRMGSGVHRRAVEALAHHKALAATTTGAYGMSLTHLRDGIVTDDAAVLGAEIARLLTSDAVRKGYERRASAIVKERHTSEKAFEALRERLGLNEPVHSIPKNSFMCVS